MGNAKGLSPWSYSSRRETRGSGFFAQLTPNVRIFAFHFKAPRGKIEAQPYKYTLKRYQHEPLFQLSQFSPRGVLYVLPYFVRVQKLQSCVPNLMQHTRSEEHTSEL